jgi:hypothetical protein
MFSKRPTVNDHEQSLIDRQAHVSVTFRANEEPALDFLPK